MEKLTDYQWQPKYDSDFDNLLKNFYEPALSSAVRYDRATGYFSPQILAIAIQGIEGLIKNQGKMRLIVGCTLKEEEIEAIEKGEKLRQAIANNLQNISLEPQNPHEQNALELLSWMIAHEYLEIKLAIPCTAEHKPVAINAIFHSKSGIIEDVTGNRLAFNGSVNETVNGWTGNWESFHVFTEWTGSKNHVDSEEKTFALLWADRAKRCLVVDVPTATREKILQFLPDNDQKPKRIANLEDITTKPDPITPARTPAEAFDPQLLFKQVWNIIQNGASVPGVGDRIGEVTSAITPYPHQVKAFNRLYQNWPPKLLIADEVGLGKTIQAGLLIRQAWLAKKAKRILIMAPKAVLKQWQIELREKFNLNIPIYDGKTLSWYECPALIALGKPITKAVSREDWHKEPIVITSSHLMRRGDRAKELTEDAEPYDLIVLDEAHHARRQGVSGSQPKGANRLLRLMQSVKYRTQGLVLLTATPMQVSPIEVWDLLNLLGLPQEWHLDNFQRFFDYSSNHNPSHAEFEFMATLFRAVEQNFGEVTLEEVQRQNPDLSKLAIKKILNALRDEATTPRRQLSGDRRRTALDIMKRNTPIKKLISRHTRELLKKYYELGKISSRIATRDVRDKVVELNNDERLIYEAVEDYISHTYNNADQAEKNAVGFIMTIYRRRLASSFLALANTLRQRIKKLQNNDFSSIQLELEDILFDEIESESLEEEDIENLNRESLKQEELLELETLLEKVENLQPDTKAQKLIEQIKILQNTGYQQVIIFTQYTDTMDFLRNYLQENNENRIICFSGRGGEILSNQSWKRISREETKKIFKNQNADILLCTDAASEGLNFQFCGALINYDMPWNPMRVEQRIGRIDRLGQVFADQGIKIINLHYADTVETDVYLALRKRIGLFSKYVGKLQPILSTLPQKIASITFASRELRQQYREEIKENLDNDIQASEQNLDLDVVTEDDLEEDLQIEPLYNLEILNNLLKRDDLLPYELEINQLQEHEYQISKPGMSYPLRITTNSEYYDEHSSSTELWSPGSPLFPIIENLEELELQSLNQLLT